MKKAIIAHDEIAYGGYFEEFKTILSYCHIEYIIKDERDITFSDLEKTDYCIAIRPRSLISEEIARTVHDLGYDYIAYYDDDLLHLKKDMAYRWRQGYMRHCLKYADMVCGPNPILMKEYSRFLKNHYYHVKDSVISPENMLLPDDVSDRVRIVFAGGHYPDYMQLIAPGFERLIEKYQDRIVVELIRLKPSDEILKKWQCVSYRDGMSFSRYREYMRNNRFDIGVAPLLDTPFRNRKYVAKYMDYSCYGIAGLYSNCMPYTLKIRDGYNGVLVNNTPEDWFSALCEAIEKISKMKGIAQNAYDDLRENYSVEKVAGGFWDALSRLPDKPKIKE